MLFRQTATAGARWRRRRGRRCKICGINSPTKARMAKGRRAVYRLSKIASLRSRFLGMRSHDGLGNEDRVVGTGSVPSLFCLRLVVGGEAQSMRSAQDTILIRALQREVDGLMKNCQ